MIYPDFPVQGFEHYPSSLQRTDKAGYAFERSEGTLANYRARFAGLSRRAHIANHAEEPMDLMEILGHLGRHVVGKSPSTWRQYRAAFIQALRDHFDLELIDDDEAEALAHLLDGYDPGLRSDGGQYDPTKSPRTSARRAKSIRTDEIDAIWSALHSNDPLDYGLQTIALYGEHVGMRPGEWLKSKIDGAALTVACGKYEPTGFRGIAPFRTLDLTASFDEGELSELRRGIDALAQLVQLYGSHEAALKRLQDRFRNIADRVSPGRCLVLRTFRDQCRANLVANGVPRKEIAAILGHSSANSQFAYGEIRNGRNTVKPVRVDPSLVALVREPPRHKSKTPLPSLTTGSGFYPR
ncbi:hypothetical protein N9H93_02735 [Rhizobiaceae bacterium]|nr:hypothetical protein [Rhizobiaceae bacterium]